MNDHLSALDATFLELEEADESAHMHVGGLLSFSGSAPDIESVREHLRARLGGLPRYSQRLSEPHTGGLAWPAWVADPGFDIASHVTRAALPAPGGDGELMEWLAAWWSQRLDRRRPLWEMVVLEGMAGGRWGLVTKTHHCMVDGASAMEVASLILDVTETPANGAVAVPTAMEADEPDSGSGLLTVVPRRALAATRAGADLALHPDKLRGALTRARSVLELIVRDEVVAAPQTTLNVPIGTLRRFDVVRIPLGDLKAIKNALGGTVNDVALAATAGGLRRLLLERGEDPPGRGMRAMVPVNVRGAAEHLALGNRVSSLFVHLPVGADSAEARYAATVAEAEGLKAGDQAEAGAALVDLTAHAPPVLHSFAAQSLFASRLFNVTITNVPGPQQPLYAFGCLLQEIVGLVPLAAAHCVGVAVLSYNGSVTFGIVADRDTVPDLCVLRDGIADELDELRRLGAVRTPAKATAAAAAAARPASARRPRSRRAPTRSRD
jgi:WS/DGAT/MGAT family acyltransferase